MNNPITAKKEVVFNKEARERIKKGIDTVCDAIRLTLGPRGRNGFIDSEMQPLITNDGKSIADSINLEDNFEHMGAWVVKNTCDKTFDDVGDSTTTTAVLLQAIIDEADKRPENPMIIRKSLRETGKRIEQWIRDEAKPIKDNQIEAVATIAAESKEIGKLIGEVIGKVGKKTPIYVEGGNLYEVEYEVVDGLETRVGFISPVFINKPETASSEHENIHVFATDKRIDSLMQLKTLLEVLDANKITSLVLLVADIDNPVANALIGSKLTGKFNPLIIKVRGYEVEDMASVCGATMISDTNGVKLDEIKLEHLGMAKKITATDKKTLIVGNGMEKTTLAVARLRSQANATKNIYEAKHLNKRADALEGGVAIIKVGAHTDLEREDLKLKILNAVNTTKSALEEGIVAGGGVCAYRLANKIKGNSIGEEILRKALKAPLKNVIENAGEDYSAVTRRMGNSKGYNADTGKTTDMIKDGVVDSAKALRCSFNNALSSATEFITVSVAITAKNERETNSTN